MACLGLIEAARENRLLRLHFSDVRDDTAVRHAFRGAHSVIHCAAAKRVDLGQIVPENLARENVESATAVVRLALQERVERTVFCSTDKVATPTSIMGASKLLIERLFSSVSNNDSRFASVRLGNILNSSGSLVDRVVTSIRSHTPITVTSPEMTRYVMSSPSAVLLIRSALERMKGGEVFIPHLKSASVGEIVDACVAVLTDGRRLANGPMRKTTIGNRYAENTHERMIADYEHPLIRVGSKVSRLVLTGKIQKATKALPPCLLGSQHCVLTRSALRVMIREQLFEDGVINNSQ